MGLKAQDTGVYYEPQHPGHGFILHVTPHATGVVWWFTYTPEGDQLWLMSAPFTLGQEVKLSKPEGIFPSRAHKHGASVGSFRVERGPENTFRMHYRLSEYAANCTGRPQVSPLPPVCQGAFTVARLF